MKEEAGSHQDANSLLAKCESEEKKAMQIFVSMSVAAAGMVILKDKEYEISQ